MSYEIHKTLNLDANPTERVRRHVQIVATPSPNTELISSYNDRTEARAACITLRDLHDGNDYSVWNTELQDWIPVDEYDVDEIEDLELSDEEYLAKE